MTTANAQCRVAGRLMVALPRDHAFRLFTPRGEQDWVPQWKPHFPAGAVDDTAPGTVFETRAHGQSTTWVVVDSTSGRRIRYARVTPQVDAGTVTVTLDDVNGQSEVTVSYELTTLSDAANAHLHAFAAQYPAFLQSWEQDIAASLSQHREL